MFKAILMFFLALVFSSNLANAGGISKEECERKGGKYCPGPKIKVCYLILKEEVSSFEEAADLCDKYDAELPGYSIKDYVNFLNCTKLPWEFPFNIFERNPLPTKNKCLVSTVVGVAEYTTLNRCSIEGKAKVMCEIPL
ncbi:hypothetical protein Anas_05413 [Armadillidium nasatum]|uniref:C-type lectin domain-containing protein n=1 Tax=Armadillidium nasatum TaxID=96803 RepID=A0A5N5TNE4_9CRUS|nr:hypothetical protein Anas_05413 [Armadillidium nasatum]